MMRTIDFDAHVFVGGITRSGKTIFVCEYFRQNEGFNIFINTNETYYVEECADIVITSIQELQEIMNSSEIDLNNLKICYNPKEAGNDITIQEVGTIINICFAIGSIAKREARGQPEIWCTLIIDEVQTWGQKAGHPAIHKLWKRGWGYGIRAIGISQRPADVSHTILTQSYYHVIFYVGNHDHPYFEDYDIPIEDHIEFIEFRSYRFVIWDGHNITRYNKVQYQEP